MTKKSNKEKFERQGDENTGNNGYAVFCLFFRFRLLLYRCAGEWL